ncbi:MAG: hypothetical protein JJE04_15575 [Acidobacteriia bacterium]|nr:hypothetical protein [Terriglobia bacterium]
MNIPEAEKLLGGYATGTLTPAERESLLEASLHNQALFEALADEEVLRELLADPAARRRLSATLAPVSETLPGRVVAALWRPFPMAAAAGFAAVAIAVVLMQRPSPVEVAQVFAPPPAVAVETPPPPAVAPRKARSVISRDSRVLRDAKELDQPAPLPPPPPTAGKPASPVVVGALERQDTGKAVFAESLSKEKRQAAADEAPKVREEAIAPFHWEIQRQDGAGVYRGVSNPASDTTVAMRVGESVRLFLEARQAGHLVVALLQAGRPSQEIFTRQVQPGDRVLAPATGSLNSAAGERELVVTLETAEQLRARANSSLRSQAPPAGQVSRETSNPIRIRLKFVD